EKEPAAKKLSLFLFGIDRAGKTTFVDYVKNEKFMDHAPTLGINVTSIVLGNVSFEFNDLGGQQAFRPMWMQYWKDPDALVFMVDANDASRFDQAREALWSVLQRDETRGKPLLVLSNKIDLPDARRLEAVKTGLALDQIPDDERDVAVFEISVKNDINLDRPMSFLASIVLEDEEMRQFVSEEVDRLVANLKEIYKAYIIEAKELEKKGKNSEAVDRLYNARIVQLQLFDNGFSKAMKNVKQCTSWIARLQRSA
nr:ADP-ribosylation factor-like protein [Candidatus Sigynarchaeota archaeon]